MDAFENAKTLFLQGLAHHNAGRLAQAEALYRQAHALLPSRVSVLVNLAAVLLQQQRAAEASGFCERALAIEPDHPDALELQAACTRALADPGQALQMLDAALAARPHDADAHNQKGVLLERAGRAAEAVRCYDRALELAGERAGVLANRAAALARLGRIDSAIADYRRALALEPHSASVGQELIHLILEHGWAPPAGDAGFDALLVRALQAPWAQPSAVAAIVVHRLKLDPVVAAWLPRVDAVWPGRLPADAALLGVLADHPPLRALLAHAPVPDIALERLLANVRGWLLEPSPVPDGDDGHARRTALHAALALQCSLNEYVYPPCEREQAAEAGLRAALATALDAGAPISPGQLLAAATLFPLSTLPAPERLLQRPWPDALAPVLARQVAEPLQEARLREALPRLTAIDDDTSRRVQRQYEEHPYPRWQALVRPAGQVTLEQYVAHRVPGVQWRRRRAGPEVQSLSAGCGTGQQPLDTALRLAGARILAVDLSRSSLAYAARMAGRLGIGNVRFAQADLLALGGLQQRFELIETTGVLHHLHEPLAGLRVLASLLDDGGVLRLALYSATARRAVVAARELIEREGFAPTLAGIRACRQALAALPDAEQARGVLRFTDFYATSECRDLLFHACEHRFDLAGVRRLLDDAGLALLGFELKPTLHRQFTQAWPDPAALRDLGAWEAFERSHPDAFAEMYTLWAERAS